MESVIITALLKLPSGMSALEKTTAIQESCQYVPALK